MATHIEPNCSKQVTKEEAPKPPNNTEIAKPKPQNDYDKGVDPDRCLAKIVKITKIEEIPKAQNIVLAHVLGWQCVIRKDDTLKTGDLAVYFSIDSILDPTNPHFAFLQGKRLKTKKIMDALSQGLLGPLSWLPDTTTYTEDEDVTKLLKVKKYIVPTELDQYADNTESRKPFPAFVPKTEENRIQDVPKIVQELPGKEIVITRKEDGTSTTYVYCNNTFLICGRNFVLSQEDKTNSHYFAIAKKFNIEQGLKSLNLNIAIQGEIVGPKINNNKLKLKELDYRVFNIWDIKDQYYLPWERVSEITDKLGLNRVPLLFSGTLQEQKTKDDYLKMADDLEYCPGYPAEGIVVKTNYNKESPRHSFKVISNKFLLKYS